MNLRIRSALGRKLVVVGACIGTDAHTVGIDAILNVKGHAGEKGLEYYREIRVVNMGAQVAVPDLVARAAAEQADAVLVSQVVTQRDAHLTNTREMSAAFRVAGSALRAAAAGGGRAAVRSRRGDDLGVDKIFGRGTTPGEVASYLVHALAPGERDERHDARAGLTVTHRRYVKYGDAHYGGDLVDGAYVLGLFGDVATEACIRMDGDEGLFASYSDVQFRAPVLAGDVIEATATVTAVGRRSRQLSFEARVVCRADPARGDRRPRSSPSPIVVVTAAGTVVVPPAPASYSRDRPAGSRTHPERPPGRAAGPGERGSAAAGSPRRRRSGGPAPPGRHRRPASARPGPRPRPGLPAPPCCAGAAAGSRPGRRRWAAGRPGDP